MNCQLLFPQNWYLSHHVQLSPNFLLQEHDRRLGPRTQGLGDGDYHLALALTLGG
jgi:hypothetical protein